jgi:hypothetical protein
MTCFPCVPRSVQTAISRGDASYHSLCLLLVHTALRDSQCELMRYLAWTSPYETCAFFTHFKSLPNFCHHQIMVSITVHPREKLDVKYTYTWMSSPVYQNTANLILSLSITRWPSKFMNVTMWEPCTLTIRFLDVAKFTILTSLSY